LVSVFTDNFCQLQVIVVTCLWHWKKHQVQTWDFFLS